MEQSPEANQPEDTTNRNRLGVVSAFICLLAVSTHPVIIKMGSDSFDPIFYAICTVLFEAIFSIPFLIYETRKVREELNRKKMKRAFWRFPIIGGIFAFAQFLISLGLETADATTGSIALKSSMIFTIIFGIIFLKEKATWLQILLTGVIFVALCYTISKGTFNALEINAGTVILVIVPLIWTMGHTMTKTMLKEKIYYPSQVIFLRTAFSSVILISVYFVLLQNPWSTWSLLFDWQNLINVIAVGLAYLIGHIFWYNAIKNIDMAIASAIQAPQPIITTTLAAIFLSEVLYVYHVIGLIIIVTSILLILREKKKVKHNLPVHN